jgi:hypothetical protein
MSSAASADALYRAVQRLRDLGELDPEEAAFLFDELFQCREDVLLDAHAEMDKALQAASSTPHDVDKLMEFLDRRRVEVRAAFHRARGELTLALLSETDDAAYNARCSQGEQWLIEDKPHDALDDDFSADEAEVGQVLEQLIKYSAAEHLRDFIAGLCAYGEATRGVSDGSCLAAIRQAREMGMIRRDQAAKLIDSLVAHRVNLMAEGDRVTVLLRRWVVAPFWTVGEPPSSPKDQVIAAQINERWDQLKTAEFRRIGEHWLADLLVHDRDGYERMCEDAWRPEIVP